MQHVGFKYCSALKLLFGAGIFSSLCHLSLKLFKVSGLEVFLPNGGWHGTFHRCFSYHYDLQGDWKSSVSWMECYTATILVPF